MLVPLVLPQGRGWSPPSHSGGDVEHGPLHGQLFSRQVAVTSILALLAVLSLLALTSEALVMRALTRSCTGCPVAEKPVRGLQHSTGTLAVQAIKTHTSTSG